MLCPRPDSDPQTVEKLVSPVKKALLCSRNLLSNLDVVELPRREEHVILKLESPHSQPRGIFQETDGAWIFAVGAVSYRGKPASEYPLLLRELLAEIRSNETALYRRVDGLNVVVAYDKPTGRVLVVQHPLAFLPVYVRESAAGIGVSTSILALAPLGGLTLDEFGVRSQYRLGHRLPPYTLFSEIRSIPPWHMLEIRAGRTALRQIWSPTFEPTGRKPAEDVREISRLLVESARGLIPKQSPVVCDLTGGYDSRMSASLLRAAGIPFSAAVAGYPDHPDVQAASRICREEGLRLQVTAPVPPLESVIREVDAALLLGEGCLDAFGLTRTIHAKLELLDGVSGTATVGGMGGEFYRDFNWAQEFGHRGRKQPASLDRLIRYRHDADSHPMEVFAFNWHQSWREQYKAHLREIVKPYVHEHNTAQIDAIFLHKLSGLYGVPVSATQAFGLVILPLMTLPALEISLGVRPSVKYGGRFQRRIIHHLSPELARYPTIRGCPAAPLQLSNCHQFLPRIPTEMKRLLRKLGSVWFRKSWFPVYTEPIPAENPFGPVLKREMSPGGCLHYPSMATAGLYREPVLTDLLAQSRQPAFRGNRTLSWIYTIEAMTRSTGAVCKPESASGKS